MVILEKPYVSNELKQYLEEQKTAVLKNETALSVDRDHLLNLSESSEFKAKYDKKTRLYTTSENALEWIYQNIEDPELINSINLMKDKANFRKLLKSIYPDFFFQEVSIQELKEIEPSSLKLPLIVKPSVGFFSIGVYTVNTLADWQKTLGEIEREIGGWKDRFPESVIGSAKFLLEEYISGEEYALDVYFDENGEPVILNIMKHDFTSSTDVSDRLYYTSKEIIETNVSDFGAYLKKINQLIGAKNFPAHIEIRVDKDRIVPIEFNPMRFAGWCTTDLVRFAFGLNTVDYYLNAKKPDWTSLLRGKEGKIYSLIVLDQPKVEKEIVDFDYNLLIESFQKVLCLRKLDYKVFPVFGFLFTETEAGNRKELDSIIKSDLTEYISFA